MKKGFIKLILVLTIIFSMVTAQPVFAEDTVSSKDLDYLKSVMDMIKEKYKGEISDEKLIEGALKGMFDTMDPYTSFFTPKEADSFLNDMNGSYEGIGVMVELDGDYIVVTKVFASSPAEKAGIFVNDKIVEVNGKSVVGRSLEETVSLIKGPSGTKVTLGVIRKDVKGIKSIEVYRGQIKLNPVSYEIRNGIGYIKIDTFNANTSEYVTQALSDMDKNNIKKIVLDLRNNPGGLVDQAVAVARNFVPKGLITKLDFKSESIKDEEYYSDLEKPKYKLVVLVNENSASASEILSGAIQDTKVGQLVGTKTFGKAKVQNFVPILTPEAFKKYEEKLGVKVVDGFELMQKHEITPSDDEIVGWSKITTGQYTTPKGRMIDQVGIEPDIYVDNYALVKEIDVNNVQKLTMTSKPKLNSEGVDVYNAEKILLLSGYDVGTPDMKLEAKTFKAIAAFQKANKLHSYGVLDYSTQQALNNKLSKLILDIDKQYSKAVTLLN
ncbi:MAG: S41 family peptidase [Clostridia bacterium]|nr:S41 family peptidase [Clostridia bacterium]